LDIKLNYLILYAFNLLKFSKALTGSNNLALSPTGLIFTDIINSIVQDDKIISVKINPVGDKAKLFDPVKAFENFNKLKAYRIK
jgi:hypothetical protein